MASVCPPLAITFFLCSIFLLQAIHTSGAFLDFLYDSAHVMVTSSSVISDYRVLVTEKHNGYIFLKPFDCRARTCSRSEHLAGSFVNQVLVPNQHLNLSNVIVSATTEKQLGALHRTLKSIHDSLLAAGLARSVRVSPELSLSSLRIMSKNHRVAQRQWGKVMEFVRKSGSYVQVEMDVEANDDALAVASAVHEAVADFAAFSGADEDIVVLHLKSMAAPSAVEMAVLAGEISQEKRILGLLVDVSSSPRRELLVAGTRATVHDDVTNPVTVPATNPATNPVSPGIVTVPSTNPGMGSTSNSNLPPLYPEPTTAPVTMPDPTTTTPTPTAMPSPVPDMNPVTAPGSVTNPTAPVTNPATTPTTVTNPANTYPAPYPQQGGGAGVGTGGGGVPTAPVYQPPSTMPGTVQPAAPTVGGQTWCVAKSGVTDIVLQNGIDYACGIGGVDCSAIQPMGSCYNPNTVQAHASYAFNSYFQRNPSPASCDFGGAGMLVNVNPSSGTCMYQTASGTGFSGGTSPSGVTGTVPTGYIPGTGPTGTAMGGGTGSTVLNANSPGGNSMYGGYDNPSSLTAGSASLSFRWVLCLIWLATFAFVKEKV